MEAACRIDLALAIPVEGRGIAGNGGIDREVRAASTAVSPSIAAERVRTVARQHPRIVQRHDSRDLPAQPRQGSQIEISAAR